MAPVEFDANRAMLRGADLFKRFVVERAGKPLASSKLRPDAELIVVERGGTRHGFVMRELAYPHMAQGTIAGEPYLVSF